MKANALPMGETGATPATPKGPATVAPSRKGKIGLPVYFTPAAHADLKELVGRFAKVGQRVSLSSLLEKQIDDLFQLNGYPRHFGTQGDDE